MSKPKPMKPARAWVLLDADGKMIPGTVNRLRERTVGMRDEPWEKSVRVRILDDAAVERAIAVLRAAEANLGTAYPFTSDIHAAIRDLGGKP